MIYEERVPNEIEKKAKKTQGTVFLPQDIDTSILETIDFSNKNKQITVEVSTEEFTSLCPFSGLPDYGKITIRYVPYKRIIELKSLKYYLFSFRQVKIYNEEAVQKILHDLKKVLLPHYIEVIGEFTVRGGIKNKVIGVYKNYSK